MSVKYRETLAQQQHSGEFTTHLPEGKVVDLQRFTVDIAGVQYELAAKHVRNNALSLGFSINCRTSSLID